MDYNYVALSYCAQKIFLYYVNKNSYNRTVSFCESTDCFERVCPTPVLPYTTISGENVFIEDTTEFLAELVAKNYAPFEIFDANCSSDKHFSHQGNGTHTYHTHFNMLYNADNFNRGGVIKVLEKYSFHLSSCEESVFKSNRIFVRAWMREKCAHVLSLCDPNGWCDPDCSHFELEVS